MLKQRICALVIAYALAANGLWIQAARAADLPDLGSPADAALSISKADQIGRSAMLQLRNAGVVIDDPQLTEYINLIGHKLASQANNGQHTFHFFLIKNDEINAQAMPGGYIAVNSGLLLATDSENELAAVLAHEISHVTQRHIAREIYDQQKSSIMSIATMLAAVVLGAATHASGQATEGLLAAGQAAAAQHQINFTRANETEADAIGIRLMDAAGFDPNAMAGFFEKLQRRYGAEAAEIPAILQDHPVTARRIAEARARARQLPKVTHKDSIGYLLAKARLQVLVANTPERALRIFQNKRDPNTPANRYGLALAEMGVNLNDKAESGFQALASRYPTVIAYRIGEAEALMGAGATKRALAVYADSTKLFPRNVPLTISYGESLIKAGQPAKAHELLLDLLNNVQPTPKQIQLIARAANAAGDIANAHDYMAEYYVSIGNLRLAMTQLRMALDSPDLQSVDRQRYKARLKELAGYLPKGPHSRDRRSSGSGDGDGNGQEGDGDGDG